MISHQIRWDRCSFLPDVIILVTQEFPQDIDRHDPQATIRLDFQDGQNSLIQDRVPDVLGGIGVGSNLGKDIVHRLACLGITSSEDTKKAEDFDLEEGVGYTGDVVFGAVACRDQCFEMSYKYRDGLSQGNVGQVRSSKWE